MGKVTLLVVLLVGLGGLVYYYQQKDLPPNPREIVAQGVAEAAGTKKLSPQERDLLKLQLALVDHVARKGIPPESLGELVPTYFDNLPRNPATNEPYAYRREGKAYLLGEAQAPTDRAQEPVQLASAGGSTTTPDGKPVLEEPFVNPNTMAADTFVYDPTGKRDPFIPFDLSPKKIADPASPLTSYDLSQLRVSAILVSPSGDARQSTAIVEDASGKGYTIKMGARIGDKNGTVVAIEPNLLKVLEVSSDFTGKETTKISEMKLEVKPAERKKQAGPRRK